MTYCKYGALWRHTMLKHQAKLMKKEAISPHPKKYRLNELLNYTGDTCPFWHRVSCALLLVKWTAWLDNLKDVTVYSDARGGNCTKSFRVQQQQKKQTISVQISSGCRAELSSYSQLECSCAHAVSEMRPLQNYIIILSTVIGLRGQQ